MTKKFTSPNGLAQFTCAWLVSNIQVTTSVTIQYFYVTYEGAHVTIGSLQLSDNDDAAEDNAK